MIRRNPERASKAQEKEPEIEIYELSGDSSLEKTSSDCDCCDCKCESDCDWLEEQEKATKKGKKPPQDISGASKGRRRRPSAIETEKQSSEPRGGRKKASKPSSKAKKVSDPSGKKKKSGLSNSKKRKVVEVVKPKPNEEEDESCTDSESDEEVRQCYGLTCVKPARPGSKYCSDECGVELAEYRIKTILPQKLLDHLTDPSRASKRNEEELDKNRRQQARLTEKLEELKRQREDLNRFFDGISKVRYVKPEGKRPVTEEMRNFCVSCGQDFNGKMFLKHLERCFIKSEKTVTLVSLTPSTGPTAKEIICDFYDPKNKLYCKRLSIICPDHKKSHNIPSEREICGAPLTDKLNISKICMDSRKDCYLHYGWDKLRVTQIDYHRLRLLFAIEKLMAKEKQLQDEMKDRGGMFDLLMNTTIDETKPKTKPQPMAGYHSWQEFNKAIADLKPSFPGNSSQSSQEIAIAIPVSSGPSMGSGHPS